MKEIIYVALGGSLGSVGRYLIGLFYAQFSTSGYPLGTLTVNLLGSLIIGVLSALYIKSGSSTIQFMLITGFCGGFTTFSTFSLDSLKLLQSGEYTQFLIYAAVSMIGGIFLCISGFWITQKMAL